jgi:hypothetical protein
MMTLHQKNDQAERMPVLAICQDRDIDGCHTLRSFSTRQPSDKQ